MLAEKDTVTKEFIRNNKRFADAFNYFLFKGEQVIKPESLREIDTTELAVEGTIKSSLITQKVRDVLKYTTIKEDGRIYYVVLGIENQTKVDNTMVIRNMVYDALQYLSQLKTGSKFLKPVITLVIYYGLGKWTGPRSLYDMIDPEFKKGVGNKYLDYVYDYKLNLIEPCVDSQENLQALTTDLRYVLSYLRAAYESKKTGVGVDVLLANDDTFNNVSKESAYVIDVLTNSQYSLRVNEKGEINMNSTWQTIGIEKYNEGKEEGIRQGKVNEIVKVVNNLLKSNSSDEFIKNTVEITQEELNAIKESINETQNDDRRALTKEFD